MSNTLWLHLVFPSLQLESGFQADQTQPVIIVDGRQNKVCQLNTAAREQGIENGMGLGSAAALCANLQVLAYSSDSEKAKLGSIARWLYLLTADIAIKPPNALLLRVTNMLSLYRGLDNYWQQLSEHLNQLNISYCYATGYSPLVAEVLATAKVNVITDSKQIINQQLSRQTLTSTRLNEKHQTQLNRLGIENIGQLQQLPLAQLAKRFDRELIDYVGKLSGQLPSKVIFHHPEEVFDHYLELFYEVNDCQYLEKPLEKVYRLLQQFLCMRGKLAFELTLNLFPREQEALTINIAHAAGSDDAMSWLKLTQLKLEHIQLKAPIIAFSVKAKRTASKVALNGDIFNQQQTLYSHDELVAILQAKLGSQSVCNPQIDADARPEVASTLKPITANSKTQAARATVNESKSIYQLSDKLRPSVLLPSPRVLTEAVDIVQGPERIVSGWWDKNPVKRDYFLARDTQGKWLWLFRTPENQWFVHGMFC